MFVLFFFQQQQSATIVVTDVLHHVFVILCESVVGDGAVLAIDLLLLLLFCLSTGLVPLRDYASKPQ